MKAATDLASRTADTTHL